MTVYVAAALYGSNPYETTILLVSPDRTRIAQAIEAEAQRTDPGGNWTWNIDPMHVNPDVYILDDGDDLGFVLYEARLV